MSDIQPKCCASASFNLELTRASLPAGHRLLQWLPLDCQLGGCDSLRQCGCARLGWQGADHHLHAHPAAQRATCVSTLLHHVPDLCAHPAACIPPCNAQRPLLASQHLWLATVSRAFVLTSSYCSGMFALRPCHFLLILAPAIYTCSNQM